MLLRVVGALAAGPLTDDLDPVSVGIEGESNMLHAAVGELLLEPVGRVLEAAARGLDAVDADADVAEAAVRLGVAVVSLEVWIVFAAVVLFS